MLKLYRKALSYAYVLEKVGDHRDLVHNAYLYYYKKTNGGNLFEQPEPYVLRCVKFMWRWNISNEGFNKQFQDYNEISNRQPDSPTWDALNNPSYKDLFFSEPTAQIDMESREAVDAIYKRVGSYHSGGLSSVKPGVLIQVMEYLAEGYNNTEIGKMMGVTNAAISIRKKKLQCILQPK